MGNMVVQVTEIQFNDLVHVAKHLAHILNGASDLAQREFNLITDVTELPDWDNISPATKMKVFDACWKELNEEGYEYKEN